MNDFRKVGLEAVIKASKFLIKEKHNVKVLKEKFGGADTFTTADRESEEIIASIVHKNFPGHAIFSEESGDMFGGSEFQWIMDPLDGTKHYLKGLPFFAVTLVLRNNKEALLALTSIPLTNEIFIAEKGKGTLYNGKDCSVSGEERLENAIIYVELPSMKFKVDWKKEEYESAWRKYENLTRACFRTRAYGSGPIGLAYTAMGAFDAYVRFQPLSYEDVLGGALMVKEAGGSLSDQNGVNLDIQGNDLNTRVIASNGKIHDQILKIIR